MRNARVNFMYSLANDEADFFKLKRKKKKERSETERRGMSAITERNVLPVSRTGDVPL
jgi:hypothetical protein